MQIGVITIGARIVGTINLSDEDPTPAADFARATPVSYEPMNRESSAPGVVGRSEAGPRVPQRPDRQTGPDGRDAKRAYPDVNIKDGAPTGGSKVYGRLADARDRAREELQAKPWLNEKAMHIFAGENPDPTASTALWESAINRAAVRGTSLEKELRHTSEGGYYEGWRDHVSPDTRKVLEQSRDRALNHSNVSGYATDNSSGSLAAKEREQGLFPERSVYNREHFFGPDTRIASHTAKWRSLVDESEGLAAGEHPSAPAARSDASPKSFVPGVDPRIQEIVGAAATHLPPGYTVRMTSGFRSASAPNHNGNAADYQIIGPDGPISNRGEDETGMYQTLARHAYGEMLARHPDLDGRFAWGGAFGTQLGGGGQRDLMHFDINGERGRYASHQLRNMGPMPGVKYGPQPDRTAEVKADGKSFDPETMAP